MVNVTKTPDPLDALASGSLPGGDAPGAQAAPPEEEQQAQAAMQAMSEGVSKFIFALAKAVRARIAKSLPEINDHWTDADLKAPADAAVPLVQKRLAMLAGLMFSYPEEGAFLVALLPLVMGYMAASDAHDKTRKERGEPPPPGPAASPVPMATVVA